MYYKSEIFRVLLSIVKDFLLTARYLMLFFYCCIAVSLMNTNISFSYLLLWYLLLIIFLNMAIIILCKTSEASFNYIFEHGNYYFTVKHQARLNPSSVLNDVDLHNLLFDNDIYSFIILN